MAIANQGMVTAHALLLGFRELRGLSPAMDDWTEERFAGNPPRLFRLRQLAALFRAFGVPWDLQSFVGGRFIQPEQPRYDALLSRLATEMAEDMGLGGMEVYRHQLPAFFAILFDYRTRVDSILSFSGGVTEASGLYLYAHRKAADLNRSIESHVAVIEDILAVLISPEAATFSVGQLVRDHGYPDVDLSAIDEDWF